MALDGTATGLIASIQEWLDDTSISAFVPDSIRMCEARLNRLLRVSRMEARADATTSGEYLALPTDCAAVRSIYVAAQFNTRLEPMESGAMRDRFSGFPSQTPIAYAISGGQLQFGPVPDKPYTIEVVYYAKLPPLAFNATNWLLTAHPDVYLYGSLLSAEMRGWNDSRLPLLKGAFDAGIAEIETDSASFKWGSGPLVPRMALRA